MRPVKVSLKLKKESKFENRSLKLAFDEIKEINASCYFTGNGSRIILNNNL